MWHEHLSPIRNLIHNEAGNQVCMISECWDSTPDLPQMFHIAVQSIKAISFFKSQQIALTERTWPDKPRFAHFYSLPSSPSEHCQQYCSSVLDNQKISQSILTNIQQTWEKTAGISALYSTLRWTSLAPGENTNELMYTSEHFQQPSVPTAFSQGAEGGRGWGKCGQNSPDSPGNSLSPFPPPGTSCSEPQAVFGVWHQPCPSWRQWPIINCPAPC